MFQEKDALDPLSEHRYWCPVVLPMTHKPFPTILDTQSSGGTVSEFGIVGNHGDPAWCHVIRILSNTGEAEAFPETMKTVSYYFYSKFTQ